MAQYFSQIQLLHFSLYVGDGSLISSQIDLAEDERASTCSFTFYDPGLKIASYLFQLSQASGGITTPPNLLEAPEAATPSPSPSPVPSTPSPSPAPTPSPVPTPTPGANPPGTEGKTSTGIYLSDAANGLKNDTLAKKIIEYCYAMKVNDIHHIAYILATCQHESVMGVYSEEIASGAAYEGRSDLGNTQAGDGVRFKGRGYVQITGRNNYSKFGRWLGEDFLTEPRNKLLAEAKFAIPTLVCGMTGTQGSPNFTGKVLRDYGSGSSFDSTNARRTVNGTDRASTISSYYTSWLQKIPSLVPASPTSLYLSESPTSNITLTPITSPLIPSDILDSAYLALNVSEAPMGRDGRNAMPTYSTFETVALAEWIAANFAFLDVVALAVGTYSKGLDAWRAIEGGGAMNDTQAHPGGGKRAGKFFVSESQWQKAKAVNSAIKDFSPDTQIAVAIEILKGLGSYLDDLKAGQYSKIFGYGKQAWPELPGGTKQKITQAEADTFFRRRITEIQAATNQGATPSPSPAPTPSPVPTTPTPAPTPVPLPDPEPGKGLPNRNLSTADFKKFCDPGVLRLNKAGSFGTGMIVESSGIAITNWHMVSNESTDALIVPIVILKSGQTVTCTVLHRNKSKDIAIIQLATGTYPVLQFGDQNSAIAVGQKVWCIGMSDLGSGGSPWDLESGTIKITDIQCQTSGLAAGSKCIQCSAGLAGPGDSGGPVMNERGLVLAMVQGDSQGGSSGFYDSQSEGRYIRIDELRAYFRASLGRDIPQAVIQTGTITPIPTPTPGVLVDPIPGQGVPGRALTAVEMTRFCEPGVLFLTMYFKSDSDPNDPAKDESFLGTAFMVESRGTFVSAGHNWGTSAERAKLRKVVVQDRTRFNEKTVLPATFLHISEESDLLIGEINNKTDGSRDVFPVMQVAKAFDLKKGDLIYCQGNSNKEGDRPWDLNDGFVDAVGSIDSTVSGSGKGGSFSSTGDVANSGDSGAPIWDKRGVVYGVHFATGSTDDIGFHSRVDTVRRFFRSKMGRDIPDPLIGQLQSSGSPGSPGLPPLSGGGSSPAPRFTGNGTPLTIAIGNWDSPIASIFNFSYTAIDVEMSGLPIVTISGKSVKWNTSQGRQLGKTYQGASLFDIAATLTAESGVSLQIEGEVDPTIPYAVQPAAGDNRTFLAALAKEYGYRLRESNSVVTLAPQAQAYDSKLVITYGMTTKLNFGDAADSQRIILRDAFASVGAKQQAPTIDLATGRIEYPKTIESVLPSATKAPDGAQIGRGYESTVELQMSDQTLNLKPGDLIWLDYSLAPNPFARDWRINRVSHSVSDSGALTSLAIYLPVYIQQQQSASPTPTPGITPSPTPTPGVTPTPSLPSPGGKKLTPKEIFDLYADAVIHIDGEGIGTGFIVTTEGHFLTCNHVLSNSSGKIKLKDGTDMTYSILGTNSNRDMTVGKLNNYTKGKAIWCAVTADGAAPNGSVLTAIGHPRDKRWTLTSAKRTGTSKCISYRGNSELDCIKSEPSLVDSGNSGGPIFNESGLCSGMAESQTPSEDGSTKIEHLRSFFLQTVGKAIPDPTAIINTPVPAPVPTPAPSQVTPAPSPAPVPPSSPPQGSVTSVAQLETLTSLRFINPEPGARVTSAFGFRQHPVQGGRKRHNGADIAKGQGSKIVAAASGTVVDIGSWGGYGPYSVTIYHGKVGSNLIFCMYAHNSKAYVKKGDFVRQGQHIADEGALPADSVTGSHLHWGCTIGTHDWRTMGYCPNNSNNWCDPIKNVVDREFTTGSGIIPDGQLDNGVKGGTKLPS